jgi:hypothetical protein
MRPGPLRRRPTWVTPLAIALAVASLWPLLVSVRWLNANRTALALLDIPPILGLDFFPTFALLIRPTIAIIATTSGLFASYLVVKSAQRALTFFMMTAALQIGLAAVMYVMGPTTNGWLEQILPKPVGTRFPELLFAPAFIARQNSVASSLIAMITGIALAYGAAAVLVKGVPPSDLSDVFDPRAAAAAERLRDVPPQPPSDESRLFPSDVYEVRLSHRRLIGFWSYDTRYEIRATTNSQEHFSYSMNTGRLRQSSDGDVVLVLTKDREAGRRRLAVINSSGQRLGTLVSRWKGWSIRDALGRPIAEIHCGSIGNDRGVYIARIGGLELCRYNWSRPLLRRPVLTVRFVPGGQIDRALAIAVAPYIEAEAYLRNQWDLRT